MELLQNELIQLWDIVCPQCGCEVLNKNGRYRGRQRFVCLDCGHSFTTYSNSVFHSTKLDTTAWEAVVDGLIHSTPLKVLSEDTGVSLVSLSRMRRQVLAALEPVSRFAKRLKEFYYNPFDTSSIFLPDLSEETLYYHLYSDSAVLAFVRLKPQQWATGVYSIRRFNELMVSVHYPKLSFVNVDDAPDLSVVTYRDDLLMYLRQFRGIKANHLGWYCHLFDLKRQLSKEELKRLMVNQLHTYKKPDGS